MDVPTGITGTGAERAAPQGGVTPFVSALPAVVDALKLGGFAYVGRIVLHLVPSVVVQAAGPSVYQEYEGYRVSQFFSRASRMYQSQVLYPIANGVSPLPASNDASMLCASGC